MAGLDEGDGGGDGWSAMSNEGSGGFDEGDGGGNGWTAMSNEGSGGFDEGDGGRDGWTAMSNEGSGGLGGCFPGGDGALSQHPLQSQTLIRSSQEYCPVVSHSPQVRAAGNGAGFAEFPNPNI